MKYYRGEITLLLITLLGVLSLVDVVTTSFVLQRGGIELNRFLALFVSDTALFFTIKTIGVIIILALAWVCGKLIDRGDHVVLGTACGMSVLPALWNSFILWSVF